MEDKKDKVMFYYGKADCINHKKKVIKRRVCFAGIVDNATLNIGEAICSEKDNFNKVLARKISTGRAYKKPIMSIDLRQYSTTNVALVFIQHCKKLVNKEDSGRTVY